MAKEYTELTGECWSLVTDNKTMFTLPLFEDCGKNSYNKFFDPKKSKIGFFIQDRTKKDNVLFVHFNLQLEDYYELVRAGLYACDTGGNLMRSYSKIYGEPQKDGRFKGLCMSTHMTISRSNVDASGNIMRSPWRITIENGYGEKVKGKTPGSFYEKSKSFRAEKTASQNFTNASFISLSHYIEDCRIETRSLFATRKLEDGRRQQKERDQEYKRTASQPSSAPQASKQAASAVSQTANTYAFQAFITEGPYKDEKGMYLIMQFSDGYKRTVRCPNGIPSNIESARRAGYPATFNGYVMGNDVIMI